MIKINDKVRILADAGFSGDIPQGSIGVVVETIYPFGPGNVINLFGVRFAGGVPSEVFYFEEKYLYIVGDGEDLTSLHYGLEKSERIYGDPKMEGVF